jgi:hypothetical protein
MTPPKVDGPVHTEFRPRRPVEVMLADAAADDDNTWDLRSFWVLFIVDWWLPTFRDNLFSHIYGPKMGLTGCTETSVTTDLLCIPSRKSEDPFSRKHKFFFLETELGKQL